MSKTIDTLTPLQASMVEIIAGHVGAVVTRCGTAVTGTAADLARISDYAYSCRGTRRFNARSIESTCAKLGGGR